MDFSKVTKFTIPQGEVTTLYAVGVKVWTNKPTGELQTTSIVFDVKSKRTEYSTSKQVWEENGITFINEKGSSTSNVMDYVAPVRCYVKSDISVSFGKPIVEIIFNCTAASYAYALKNSIEGATASGSNVSVKLDGSSNSFSISSLAGQVRITSIDIKYYD